jgi:DNA-binding transcriptional LysR family regulator
MLPDFNRLKVFYFIYKNLSGAAAAKELNVSQPAVSQHLANLETEMKARLFTRMHKRLVPTPAGERLFSILEPFIAELQNGIGEIHQTQQGPSGILRIGAPVGFGEKYLPAIFGSFINLYPAVSFYLELGHPTILLPLISEGRLDFAYADIFTGQQQFSRDLAIFSITPVAREDLLLVCSRSYYLKHLQGEVTLESLLTCRYVAYRKHTPAIATWFRHHFNKQSVCPDIALTVESVRAVINGIKHDLGLAVVPAHFVAQELDNGEILAIRTGKKEISNRISLVRLQDKIPGPSEKMFLEHFTNEMSCFLPEPV